MDSKDTNYGVSRSKLTGGNDCDKVFNNESNRSRFVVSDHIFDVDSDIEVIKVEEDISNSRSYSQ